jgi:hypothetical protein
MKRRGNCYAASEALYHILGGKRAGWKPMHLKGRGIGHWYLQHKSGMILDPSGRQFDKKPDYSKGKGCGFLTKRPSVRARMVIDTLTYAPVFEIPR